MPGARRPASRGNRRPVAIRDAEAPPHTCPPVMEVQPASNFPVSEKQTRATLGDFSTGGRGLA